MRTRRSKVWAAAMILLAASVLPQGVAAQGELTGSWTARQTEDGVRLRLVLDDDRHDWGWGSTVEAANDLWDATGADGEVDWTLTAPAGELTFVGWIRGERGIGEFSFRPNPEFRDLMAEVGVRGRIDEREMLSATLQEVAPESVRELRDLGFEVDDFDEALSGSIFEIDREFVGGLRAEGLDGDLEDFLAFRIHGVTPDFVREVEGWGIGPVDADELLAFRIHGVRSEWIREMADIGFDGLDADELVSGRIHGVSPDFAEAVAEWGFGRLDFDDLVSMRIHGVTERWLERLAALDLRPTRVDDALSFRIHGVTPEWIEELREMGYDDLDADDLIQMRIHGFDRFLRRRGGGAA